jgi:nucleoside-diphosphate-sugar epimerase
VNLSVTIIGCGWLGLPLGKELSKNGYVVHGSVRNERKFDSLREANIKPFLFDLERSPELPEGIVEITETLIICAPPLFKNEPHHYREALDELLGQFSEEVVVIFTSSTGIYPKVAGNFVESFEFNSEQDSTVLLIAENAILHSKNEHVIFRLGGLVGPNRHPIRYLQGRTNVKNPDGPINFVHQGDCIRAISEAIANGTMRGTFNLVYPSYPSRKNYYTEAANHYGLVPPTFSQEVSIQRTISSEKIIRDFSFLFEFPIDKFPELDLN